MSAPEFFFDRHGVTVTFDPCLGNGTGAEPRPPAFSDDALALRFSQRHPDLRFVAAWSQWFRWTGTVWREDDTLAVFDQARDICRAAASECDQKRIASAIASGKTVAAVERLARADRRHAATVDQWDADPWGPNTPDGIIDLRTGDLRPHDPLAYATKSTAVGPAVSADCPIWHKFLNDVTAGDADLQAYLQRLAGYALTGVTSEHVFAFLHGTGANGKSVFLTTLSGLMGDYAISSPVETFTASNTDQHPTELARLRGARLVVAVETEQGRRWAESRIKALTGGDRIAARFVRQDFFEFVPQFKLIVAGNHKPGLRSVDEAIRRRLHLVPFTVTIPPEDRDQSLPDRLKAEWPAILRWCIDGCLAWQRQGLAPPAKVTEASNAYLETQDVFGAWLDEACEFIPTAWTGSTALYASFKAYAERNGEFVGTQRRFVEQLEARGFRAVRIGHKRARGYAGVALRPPQDQDQLAWQT